jgi:hypothetical protein
VPEPSQFFCEHKDCRAAFRLTELPWRADGGYPLCPTCGKVMRERVSAPSVIWTGAIGKRYRTKGVDGYDAPDGIRMYTRKTPDGKPKMVELSDWGQVKSFCRQEGLADPRQQGLNMEVGEDGKSVKNTCGMPGTEV